jgi:hypothetical protein
VLVEEHVRLRGGRRDLAAVDAADLAGVRVVVHEEGAAADT